MLCEYVPLPLPLPLLSSTRPPLWDVVVAEPLDDNWRNVNLGVRARPAVIMGINLDVSKQIINTMAGILKIVHTVAQIRGVGIATAIAILPAAHPFRDRGQSSALSITSSVWDSRIGSAVGFENGQW